MSFEVSVPSREGVDESQRDVWTEKVCSFLRSIGLTVNRFPHEVDNGFIARIKVVDGRLNVYKDVFPGDILHEAGHLCTMPSRFRPLAKGSLMEAFKAMSAYMDENFGGLLTYPEDPVYRGALQCSDPEATAWQYAAAQHIGLPDDWLFPRGSYDGTGETILQALKNNAYIGINGLQAAGWTSVRANSFRAEIPVFPELAYWVRD